MRFEKIILKRKVILMKAIVTQKTRKNLEQVNLSAISHSIIHAEIIFFNFRAVFNNSIHQLKVLLLKMILLIWYQK